MKRLILIFILLVTPVMAVEPDEMLSDPALEARAQALDNALRCVQCQSESIASSNATWARDARLKVRELIEGGATDSEVETYFIERFGEFVLMQPRASGANLILWISAPLMFLAAIAIAVVSLRRRPARETGLSDEEKAKIAEILEE